MHYYNRIKSIIAKLYDNKEILIEKTENIGEDSKFIIEIIIANI